jgi:hypothetical protein
MKSLTDRIKDVLTPQNSIGLVSENLLYQLTPLFPLTQIEELYEDLDHEGKQLLLKWLTHPKTVIYAGIVYQAIKGLNFRGRLKEIMTIYHQHLKNVIGNKKALIDLYEKISPEDLTNLTQNHVIFVLKSAIKDKKKELAAIRYLPPYEIHFENITYYMPGCTLAIHIDSNLTLGNPEVIPEDSPSYTHPFVYRDRLTFGQKICMGTFYTSDDKFSFQKLRFANNINALIRQSTQILITGYNRGVSPASGHLTDAKYKKYTIKPENWESSQKWGVQ